MRKFQDLSHQKMGAIEKTCAIKQHETLSTLTRPSASIHLEKLICVSAPPRTTFLFVYPFRCLVETKTVHLTQCLLLFSKAQEKKVCYQLATFIYLCVEKANGKEYV